MSKVFTMLVKVRKIVVGYVSNNYHFHALCDTLDFPGVFVLKTPVTPISEGFWKSEISSWPIMLFEEFVPLSIG